MKRTKHRGIYEYKKRNGAASYYIRTTVKGKRTFRKAGNTLLEALNLQNKLESRKLLTGFGFSIPKKIRFHKLAELYFDDYLKRNGPGNEARVRSCIKKLNKHFGNILIHELAAEDIEKAYLPRADLIMLRIIFNAGKRWGFLVNIPEITIPRRRKLLDRAIKPDELNKILKQASPDHKDAILLCVLMGGLRLSELTKINRDNTDFERGYVDIVERKQGVPKRFYLTERATSIIKRRFIMNKGVAFKDSPAKLSQRFLYERKRMKGVKPWRFHDLRHTVATRLMVDYNIKLEVCRLILGHTSTRTTELYMHTSEEKEREALNKLSDYYISELKIV